MLRLISNSWDISGGAAIGIVGVVADVVVDVEAASVVVVVDVVTTNSLVGVTIVPGVDVDAVDVAFVAAAVVVVAGVVETTSDDAHMSSISQPS